MKYKSSFFSVLLSLLLLFSGQTAWAADVDGVCTSIAAGGDWSSISVYASSTWKTGATGCDDGTAAVLPKATDTVTVNSATATPLTSTTAAMAAKTLTINAGAAFTPGANTLTLTPAAAAGAFVNNGTFNGTGSTVAFAADATISGSSATAFDNVTTDGVLTLAANTTIAGTLKMNHANAVIALGTSGITKFKGINIATVPTAALPTAIIEITDTLTIGVDTTVATTLPGVTAIKNVSLGAVGTFSTAQLVSGDVTLSAAAGGIAGTLKFTDANHTITIAAAETIPTLDLSSLTSGKTITFAGAFAPTVTNVTLPAASGSAKTYSFVVPTSQVLTFTNGVTNGLNCALAVTGTGTIGGTSPAVTLTAAGTGATTFTCTIAASSVAAPIFSTQEKGKVFAEEVK